MIIGHNIVKNKKKCDSYADLCGYFMSLDPVYYYTETVLIVSKHTLIVLFFGHTISIFITPVITYYV